MENFPFQGGGVGGQGTEWQFPFIPYLFYFEDFPKNIGKPFLFCKQSSRLNNLNKKDCEQNICDPVGVWPSMKT